MVHESTMAELSRKIATREVSAFQVVRSSLDAISARDGEVGAFLQVFADEALDKARSVDARIARGEHVGPLAGVPVALKDNICTDFGRTTCGSRMLENYRSPFSATAAGWLVEAGAVVVGKTNLDEFAMGSSTENSALKQTSNPWDLSRVAGGSSGGSAAAVAARLVPGALGSDTGGSVRQPAAFCGLVGVKPTYGRVSRWGLVAYASSLDQIGPLTTTVADSALLLNTICGPDPLDSTSSDAALHGLLTNLDTPIPSLRLGVPRQVRSHGNHPAVTQAFEESLSVFRSLGATIVDIDLPRLEYGIAAYYIIALAEASSNLARFDGVRYGLRTQPRPGDDITDFYARSRAEGLGAEVQRRIMLGAYVLSSGYYDAYYLTALKARRLIKNDFDHAFGSVGPGGEPSPRCDAILMPTAPTPAFKRGEKSNDPVSMYLEDVYTVPVNLAGIAAASVPCGFAQEAGTKLPLGLQILCPAFEEERLLRIARMYEAATPWGSTRPGE